MRRTRVGRHSSKAPPGRSSPAILAEIVAEDAAAIDALYGLEPVFEPGAPGTAPSDSATTGASATSGDSELRDSCFQDMHCPYCGEPFETLVDLSAGSADYIEDCQVCCRPIQFHLEVDHAGRLVQLMAARGD